METNGVVAITVAVLVGILAAFLLAGPALFADGADAERLTVVLILALVLGLTGLAVGALAPPLAKITPWFLAAPSVLIAIFFAAKEPNILQTALLVVAGAVGFSLAGAFVGARLRSRRSAPPAP